jgi:hypothetical protein
MVKKTYESIEEEIGRPDITITMLSSVDDTREYTKKGKIYLVAGMVALCMVAALMFVGGNHDGLRASSTNIGGFPSLSMSHPKGSGGPRKCEFHECHPTSCDPGTAPYTCIRHNGGPHGGCSMVPWTPETCEDQCDLSDCASVRIPHDAESCQHMKCSDELCASPRLCHDAAPYQCMAGSGMYGCSSDKYHWAFQTTDATCSVCCDATAC